MSKLIHITSLPKGVSTGLITSRSGSLLFCSTTHIFSLCTKVNIKSKMCNAVARGVNDIVMTKITTFLIITPCHGWKKMKTLHSIFPSLSFLKDFQYSFLCVEVYSSFSCHAISLSILIFPQTHPLSQSFLKAITCLEKWGLEITLQCTFTSEYAVHLRFLFQSIFYFF